MSHLVQSQLFEVVVIGVQFLQSLVDRLLQRLQYTFTQSSFDYALCRHKHTVFNILFLDEKNRFRNILNTNSSN